MAVRCKLIIDLIFILQIASEVSILSLIYLSFGSPFL